MSFGIIIKGKHRPPRKPASQQNKHLGPWSNTAQAQYKKSKYKADFKQEKMVQELDSMGWKDSSAIATMTQMSVSAVKTMQKKVGKNIHLDGKL